MMRLHSTVIDNLCAPFEFIASVTKNCGNDDPNLNDCHSDPVEINSSVWLPYSADWWRQQENMHSKYTDLCNVAHDTFSIIPHGFGVEASFGLGEMLSAGGNQNPQP